MKNEIKKESKDTTGETADCRDFKTVINLSNHPCGKPSEKSSEVVFSDSG